MAITGTNDVMREQAVSVGSFILGASEIPTSFTIALAASGTTDGMDITVTIKDRAGLTLARVCDFTLYMSEAATGLGLTADTYSGTLTATTGVILGTMTAKKAFRVQTDATGVFAGTLVASANPTDQYVVAAHPITGALTVSDVSGTNWEGAS